MQLLSVRARVTSFLLLLGLTVTPLISTAAPNWKLVVVECSPQQLERITARIGVAVVDARPGRYLIAVDSREDVRAIEAIVGEESVAASDNENVRLPRRPNRFNPRAAAPAPNPDPTSIGGTGGWTDYFGVRTPMAYAKQPAAQKIGLEQAQQFATGRRTIVAVIDTGVDPLHPLLKNVLLPGRNYVMPGSDASEWNDPTVDQLFRDTLVDQQHRDVLVDQLHRDVLVDQQLRQLIATQSTSGFAVNQLYRDVLVDQLFRDVIVDQLYRDTLVDGELPAAFGHGTMTAGLVHLVAPDALIIPMKAFDAEGTSTVWEIVNAIHDSVEMGADVINMSFSSSTNSKVLERTITWARSRGVVLVGSAGNNDTQVPTYPASINDVMATAGLTIEDDKASFSNYGRYVDLSAPGVGLVTAFPGNHWAVVSGTSFSTTLVSGEAALLHELGLRGDAIRSRIEDSVDELDTPDEYEDKLGEGRINVLRAVRGGQYN
jgi:subtilisin family serine protease